MSAVTECKLWLVTGASRGLGAAFAKALLQSQLLSPPHQNDLLLTASNKVLLSDVGERLSHRAAPNVHVCAHVLDLADVDCLEQNFDCMLSTALPRSLSDYTDVTIVNNAASLGPTHLFWNQQPSKIKELINTNVTSYLMLNVIVLSKLKATARCKSLTIVNISSISAVTPYECFGIYGTGKAARHMAMSCLARDVDKHPTDLQFRLRCFSYAPGPIDTDMQTAARLGLPSGSSIQQQFQENWVKDRLVKPEDSAQRLVEVLEGDAYENGAHVDYFDTRQIAHPLVNHK